MNDDTTPTGRLDAAVPDTPLTPLRRLLHYRIAAGDPDVRGWEVLGADGRKIGEVDDLLVDTEQLRARYLDVTLDPGLGEESGTPREEEVREEVHAGPEPETLADLGGLGSMMQETVVRATLSEEENRLTQEHHLGIKGRHVLIPVGRARLDAEHDRVLVEGLRSVDAPSLPDYSGQTLDRDYETSLRRRFDETYAHSPEADFYAHHLYDEDRFYGSRRGVRDQASAESARVAGLAPGAPPAGEQDRAVTGELDRAVEEVHSRS